MAGMNRENFSDYLEEPSKLYQLSYQELKSLVLQHPYCANLHVLLLQKAQLDNNPAFSKNLEQAAVHTFDRAYLYDLIKSQKLLSISREDFIEFEEEILELQDINSLEEKVEKIPLVANENDSSKGITREASPFIPPSPPNWNESKDEDDFNIELDLDLGEKLPSSSPSEEIEETPPPGPADIIDPTPAVIAEENETALEEEVEEELEIAAEPESEPYLISASLAKTISSFGPVPSFVRDKIAQNREKEAAMAAEKAAQEAVLNDLKNRIKAIEKEVAPPLPKKKFNSWKRQLKPRKLPKPILSQKPKEAVQQKAEPEKVSVIAKRSLEDSADIASETLAIILTKQHQYAKAIDMYERLKLKNPQKSVYFAGKIEELIKLM